MFVGRNGKYGTRLNGIEEVAITSKEKKEVVEFLEKKETVEYSINKYKEIPAVKSVRVIFITDPTADYAGLESMAQKNNRITETLNHIMNSVTFDCDTCNLKAVCDEVEGMKELHFKNAAQKD